MTTWQPIETAPKDGTPILVCSGNYWGDPYPLWPRQFPEVVSWRSSHKQPECWCDKSGFRAFPKYWMPVPPDPSGNSNKPAEQIAKSSEQIAKLARFFEFIASTEASLEDKGVMFLEAMHRFLPDISTDGLKDLLPKLFDLVSPEAYEVLSNLDLKAAIAKIAARCQTTQEEKTVLEEKL